MAVPSVPVATETPISEDNVCVVASTAEIYETYKVHASKLVTKKEA